MPWLKKLFQRTKEIAAMYTAVFIVVMFLNQLLFFGLCLNPVCLIAAIPHVLLLTFVIGTLIYKPSRKQLKKTLRIASEGEKKIRERIKRIRNSHGRKEVSGAKTKITSGRVYLFVTQSRSQGEEDFVKVLSRYGLKSHSVRRQDSNRYKSKALFRKLENCEPYFEVGDVVAIVRGGGDTNTPQFSPYRDEETCLKLRGMKDNIGTISVTGIGHSSDPFPIESAVDFAQITPTDAANRVGNLINGRFHL